MPFVVDEAGSSPTARFGVRHLDGGVGGVADVHRAKSIVQKRRGLREASLITPFTAWTLVPFPRQIPFEIEEAVIVDGARLWQVMLQALRLHPAGRRRGLGGFPLQQARL
ncbi:MAG: hypothetical protein QOG89_3578 [Thermomicrobiales bacterium]|nr:hypothetical protein [Thermomicrobiales bacterium]